ncbi:hypothetical protein ACOMHN_067138 [Nucella lapillus]
MRDYLLLVSEHEVDVDLRPSEEDLNNIGNKQNHQRQFTGGHHHKEDDRSDDNDGDDGAADNAGRRRGGHEEGDCEVRDCAGLENPRSVRAPRSQQLRTIFVWYADDDLYYMLKTVVEPLEQRASSKTVTFAWAPPSSKTSFTPPTAAHAASSCCLIRRQKTTDSISPFT